jgi:redox-sensitive bicupin YhaK (pirin superfamily)
MNKETLTPKLTVHRASSRGAAEHGWLSTRHSFSFGRWYHPSRLGFGALRVLNDDKVTAGRGFGAHDHDNMEIVSIVTAGKLAHRDDLGNEGSLEAGEVQVMSAGSGIRHSEYNGGKEVLAFFQIWIIPGTLGVVPRYDRRAFPDEGPGELLLVAPVGHRASALHIYQDAYISRLTLDAGYPLEYTLKGSGHGTYFFVVEGSVVIAGERLEPRDALGVENLDQVALSAGGRAVVLAIEVPVN